MRLFIAPAALAACLATTALLSFHSNGVEAGTAVRMDVAQLVQNAELVVEARVLSAVALESDSRIETEYLLEVQRTFAGADEAYRTVRLPGGVLPDGRGMILAGMPRIVAGRDLILFLSAEGAGGMRMPVGLAQGKLDLVTTREGARVVVQDATGVSLVRRENGRVVRNEGRSVRNYVDVVAEIEAALAAKRAR